LDGSEAHMVYQRPHQPSFLPPRQSQKPSPFAPRPFPAQTRRTAQREPLGADEQQATVPDAPVVGEVSTAGVGPALIQRDVGFEFETGWLVTKEENEQQKSLKKKDPVGAGGYGGFNVEADEALNDASEVEFVLHPPIPVARGGLAALNGVMTEITSIGNKLKTARGVSNGAPFSLQDATGRQADAPWQITPVDADLKAGPQVTAGLLLRELATLGQDSQEAPLPGGFNRTKLTSASNTAAFQDLDRSKVVLPADEMSPELVGLLSVILSYLRAGESRGLEYPKQIADVFVLARTDLAQMFKMLPKLERDFFQKNGSHWVNLVMQLAAAAEIEGSAKDQVILHGVRANPQAERRAVGPSRELWLIYMYKGVDLLSGALDDELESMGAMGDKTEKVGPDQEDAPIFELRGAQTAKIPVTEWKTFAAQTYQYLLRLQNPEEFAAENERARQSALAAQARQKYLAKLGIHQ
jgi:hypothetical protein